ncbi:MAG: hypothetical protein AAF417_04385 [Pseudomonadota bacterium]
MRSRTLIALLATTLPATAVALDEQSCAAIVKGIDDRIAAGNHSQQNVSIATQMRDSIAQSCSMMNQATIDQMMVGLDRLLPPADGAPAAAEKSKAERDAERAAQRAEANRRQAEREQRRAVARAKQEEKVALVSAVVRQSPEGESLGGRAVARSDPMWGVTIVDWDLLDGGSRLLYQTWPSRSQAGDSEVGYHYYVLEVDREGNHNQSHVLKLPMSTTSTAGLLPGTDEVVVQRRDGDVGTLQRWSISDGELLGENGVPTLDRSVRSREDQNVFRVVTHAGDLLFAETVPMGSGPTARSGVTWMLASVEGEPLDRGFIEGAGNKIAMSDWFRSADGGAALLLDVIAVDDAGIESTLELDALEISNVIVEPAVFSEQRMYFTETKAPGPTQPSFMRRHMWLGLENVPQQAMISGESGRLTKAAENGKRLNDSSVYSGVAGRNRTAFVSFVGGAGILVQNNDQDTDFPQRGLWLEEFASDGAHRQTFLGPDAEHLSTRFDLMASDKAGNLYVASDQAVLMLGDDRTVRSYSRMSNDGVDIGVMVADDGMAWLFGIAQGGAGEKQRVWIESVRL